jgi:hypothetical protein
MLPQRIYPPQGRQDDDIDSAFIGLLVLLPLPAAATFVDDVGGE